MTVGTKEQYAEKLGKTKAYLSKKKVKAMLEPAMVPDPAGGRPKIDFEKADALFARHRDPSRFLGKTPRDDVEEPDSSVIRGPTFENAKTEREIVKLQQDRLNLLERKSQTLLKKDVENVCAAAGQEFREHLQARNRRIADKIATMKDPREIRILLDDSDRQILAMISNDLMRKLFPEAAEPGDLTTH